MKAEWTSVLGNRAFLDVLVGNWWNFFPLRPVRDYGLYDGPWGPGRVDTGEQPVYDGGANNGYQDQKRWKPQVYVSLSYFKDGWRGSHDFKVGYDSKRDRRSLFRDQPFDIFYRDTRPASRRRSTSTTPSVAGINDVVQPGAVDQRHLAAERPSHAEPAACARAYKDEWPEQEFAPNGIPAPGRVDRPDLPGVRAPRTVERRTVADTKDLVAAHRRRLRPHRRQPHGAEGVLRPVAAGTRPTRSPTRRTRSASRSCATRSCRARRRA